MIRSLSRRSRFALLGFAAGLLMAGCHSDTGQGGGQDSGHAAQPARVQSPASVPSPPTADQVDPDSPRAVLDGTSTTQSRLKPQPNLRPSHP